MLSRITLLLFLTGVASAFTREEWFRGLDLEPALNEASLVLAAQVLDVSETKMVFGGKMETTLREYRFAPVLIMKGVYARDTLSMSSQDLGLLRFGEASPIERGQFRLLMLGRSRNGYAILRPESRLEHSIPPVSGASDGLIESVKTLLAVSATTDRLERVHLLAAGLQARSGVAAVPLLVSMERRRLLAAQTPGVIDAISRQLGDSSQVVREQAAQTIRSLLESDYLDQADLLQTAVRTLVASLAHQDPNIAFRVAALEAVGAAGHAALDDPGARTLLESPAPSSFAELGARFHAVGQLGLTSERDAVVNTLRRMPLDATSDAQSETEWAVVKLDPGKGVPDVTLRLKQKLAAGLPVVTEIQTLGDAPAALAVPALVDIFRQPLEHAERMSPIAIAGAVRQLRAALACTQSQLAEMAAVAVSTVARAETNTLPDTTVLKKFARLARQHHLIDIAQVFEQAQVPNFFATPEELRRIELKRQLLTSIDTLDSARLDAIETILQPVTWPTALALVDDVPPPPWEFHQSQRWRDLKAQSLAMLQAARGSTGVLDQRQTEEAHALCATAWLLGNDEVSDELIEFLIDGIQRVLEQSGSGLSEHELEALGFIGARASTPAHILLLARQLRERIDSAIVLDKGSHVTSTLTDVIGRERARSLATAEQFSESIGITTDQLRAYESAKPRQDFVHFRC